MTTFPESFVLESSWLSDACTIRKDPESAYRLNDWPETTRKLTSLTIKREAESCGGAVLLGPLTLLLSTWAPFSILSFSLSASVCPQTIHFQMLEKRPLSGPGRDHLSCNKITQSVLTALWQPELRQFPTLLWFLLTFSLTGLCVYLQLLPICLCPNFYLRE